MSGFWQCFLTTMLFSLVSTKLSPLHTKKLVSRIPKTKLHWVSLYLDGEAKYRSKALGQKPGTLSVLTNPFHKTLPRWQQNSVGLYALLREPSGIQHAGTGNYLTYLVLLKGNRFQVIPF